MAGGEDDVYALSALGSACLQATPEALQESLQGALGAYHRFLLTTLLEHVEFLEHQIARLDARLEEQMHPFAAQLQRLDSIVGLDQRGAQNLLAELGLEMAQLPDAAHLASWAGMSPGNNESAWKRQSGKTTKGNKGLRRTLTQAAWAATRRKTGYLAAQYRRLAARRGKKWAMVAVGHSIIVAAYYVLKHEVGYHDLGAEHFERRQRDRMVVRLVVRLKRLGYHVALEVLADEAA